MWEKQNNRMCYYGQIIIDRGDMMKNWVTGTTLMLFDLQQQHVLACLQILFIVAEHVYPFIVAFRHQEAYPVNCGCDERNDSPLQRVWSGARTLSKLGISPCCFDTIWLAAILHSKRQNTSAVCQNQAKTELKSILLSWKSQSFPTDTHPTPFWS